MKKISKAEQRKLYRMFEEAVDRNAGLLATLKSVSTLLIASHEEIHKDVQKKKDEFLKMLEDAKAVLVTVHYDQDWTEYEDGQYSALNNIEAFDLMKCLVVGH